MQPYVAQQLAAGTTLEKAWPSYSEAEKPTMARNLAELIVAMGEIRFSAIGGITSRHQLGPTVEGSKNFNGRHKFHSHACYDIGPYRSKKDYALAQYDKEIYYYTQAPEADIDAELFEEVPVSEFVRTLQMRRQAIASDPSLLGEEEPFVLVHGNLHGNNIMVNGTKITALLDWDFAGSYPLSELTSDGVEVTDMANEELEEEVFK